MVRINIDPALWGNVLWHALFDVAFRASDDRAAETLVVLNAKRQLLDSLQHVLPCASCRESCGRFSTMFPPTKVQQGGAGSWIWALKDMVNGKVRHRGAPYRQTKNKYDAFPFGIVSDEAVLTLVLFVALGADDASAEQVGKFALAMGELRSIVALRAFDSSSRQACVESTRRAIESRGVPSEAIDALAQRIVASQSTTRRR